MRYRHFLIILLLVIGTGLQCMSPGITILYGKENSMTGICIAEHLFLQSGPGETADTNMNSVEDEIFSGWAVRSLDEPETNGWIKIETHYGYEGYVPADSVRWCTRAELEERQDKERFFRIAIGEADLLSEPKVQGVPLELMIKDAVVEVLETGIEDGWAKIRTASGKEGFTREFYLCERKDDDRYLLDTDVDDPHKKRFFAYQEAVLEADEEALREAVVQSALKYLGTQYRWGGKSSQGLDCSGLVFMSYLEQGVLLHRDAGMPEEYPMHEIQKEELKKGDLIFFPGHVTIYMGDGKFIHSTAFTGDGRVTINSLDPESPLYRKDLEGKIEGYGSLF